MFVNPLAGKIGPVGKRVRAGKPLHKRDSGDDVAEPPGLSEQFSSTLMVLMVASACNFQRAGALAMLLGFPPTPLAQPSPVAPPSRRRTAAPRHTLPLLAQLCGNP